MATTSSKNSATKTPNQDEFNPYLSPTQQDLLIAALASSNSSGKGSTYPPPTSSKKAATSNPVEELNMNAVNTSYFTSPEQPTPGSATFGSIGIEDSPFIDYLEPDSNFDLEPIEGGDMIGALPGSASDLDADLHEKRKSIGDNVDDEEGGGKRREGEDKTAKKPGRKPLQTEPTTVSSSRFVMNHHTNDQKKRKAQNRAAQRAFRERKEKHLKDLETKVDELEKESETKNHENGLLRAQVARLQIELREYRKRLSLNSTGLNRSPSLNGMSNLLQKKTNTSPAFEFEFPRFGGLPGSHIFNNDALTKDSAKNTTLNRSTSTPNASSNAISSRNDSAGQSISPKGHASGNSTAMQSPNTLTAPQTNGIDDLASLFSPSILKTDNNPYESALASNINGSTQQNNNSSISSENSIGSTNRIFRFNSTPSTTASPSDSSTSQYNANSSCGTSPEPYHNSPGNLKTTEIITGDATTGGYICHGNSEGEIAFCEMLNMACGNPRNPVPRAISQSDGTPAPTAPTNNVNASITSGASTPAATKNSAADTTGIDWLANQNGGQFDPVLFGEYRESQDAIVGGGDFTGGFFSDAFNLPEFGSPSVFGQNTTPNNLMMEVEKTQNGLDDEEMVPGEDPTQMLNCNKIW